ncbi:MAG: hypothetical protein N2Z80_06350 [Hydrogenothermaceae bacterium]|nr:hypothetical protein [Hydrogenothermaceae bacterium]
MVDPTAFQQIEKSDTELLLKILIPPWIVLSVTVTVWSYRSTRANVFWKNPYKSIFPPIGNSSKEEKKKAVKKKNRND